MVRAPRSGPALGARSSLSGQLVRKRTPPEITSIPGDVPDSESGFGRPGTTESEFSRRTKSEHWCSKSRPPRRYQGFPGPAVRPKTYAAGNHFHPGRCSGFGVRIRTTRRDRSEFSRRTKSEHSHRKSREPRRFEALPPQQLGRGPNRPLEQHFGHKIDHVEIARQEVLEHDPLGAGCREAIDHRPGLIGRA